MKESENFKEQTSIAIGAVIGFLVGLITGFPLGVIWIAVGSLVGGGSYAVIAKHRK